jgi:hypothetical protein
LFSVSLLGFVGLVVNLGTKQANRYRHGQHPKKCVRKSASEKELLFVRLGVCKIIFFTKNGFRVCLVRQCAGRVGIEDRKCRLACSSLKIHLRKVYLMIFPLVHDSRLMFMKYSLRDASGENKTQILNFTHKNSLMNKY